MAELDDENCWLTLVNRRKDADGVFFYAVRTTGVFCRPSCPARLPLRKNVSYYASAREAQAAGFRPSGASPGPWSRLNSDDDFYHAGRSWWKSFLRRSCSKR